MTFNPKTLKMKKQLLFCSLLLYAMSTPVFSQIERSGKAAAEAMQSARIEQLRLNQSTNRYRLRTENGVIRKLDINVPTTSIYPEVKTTEDFARRFLADNEELLRIHNTPASLKLIKRQTGLTEYYSFLQESNGFPVYGSWLKMNFSGLLPSKPVPDFIGITGRYIPDLDFQAPKNIIDTSGAVMAVYDLLKIERPDRFRLFIPPKLWLFDAGLISEKQTTDRGETKLAWRVVFACADHFGGGRADAFVDALTGKVLFIEPRNIATDIDVETANHATSSLCWYDTTSDDAWFDEDGRCRFFPFQCSGNVCADGWNCANPDQEGYDAYYFSKDIIKFFKDVYGMNSYDGNNEEVETYVHVGTNWENANSVDCGLYAITQFGDQMIELDIYAHEIGHSFHRSQAGFVYAGPSGAIAEHIGDAYGMFISHWTGKDSNWQLGEGCSIGTIRDIQNPPASRDEYSEFASYTSYNSGNDYGEVHANANILNKAFYLMINGGTFKGYSVTGVGEGKIRTLYHLLVKNLPSNPTFEDFRDEVLSISYILTWDFGFFTPVLTNNDYCNIRKAFAAIGLADGDSDCDGILDPNETDDDNDGYPDNTDKCPHIYSFSNSDMDGDGTGDVCDEDIDGDGVLNTTDNCKYMFNPNQADSDNDGRGNVCEDTDNDGVADGNDNCPNVSNRTQADMDHDGTGDVCDSDMDGDGRPNNNDNCPGVANLNQADGDSDGSGDACDNCLGMSNPGQSDIDNDGLGDTCDPDRDGDGFPNDRDECPDEVFRGRWPVSLGNGCWFDAWIHIPPLREMKPFLRKDILMPEIVFEIDPGMVQVQPGVYNINTIRVNTQYVNSAIAERVAAPVTRAGTVTPAATGGQKISSKAVTRELKKNKIPATPVTEQPVAVNIALMDSYGNLLASKTEYVTQARQTLSTVLTFRKVLEGGPVAKRYSAPAVKQQLYLVITPKLNDENTTKQLRDMSFTIGVSNEPLKTISYKTSVKDFRSTFRATQIIR